MKKLLIILLIVAPLIGCSASIGIPSSTRTTYTTETPVATSTTTTYEY